MRIILCNVKTKFVTFDVHESPASLSIKRKRKSIRELIPCFIPVASFIYNTAAYMITRRLHVES